MKLRTHGGTAKPLPCSLRADCPDLGSASGLCLKPRSSQQSDHTFTGHSHTLFPDLPHEAGLTPPGLPELWPQHVPAAPGPESLDQSCCHHNPFLLLLPSCPSRPARALWPLASAARLAGLHLLAADRTVVWDYINLNALFIHPRLTDIPASH